MVRDELDEVDRGILFLLHQNARRNTTTDISGKVDVSSSTVANRIKKMEKRGVIEGYHPSIDYEAAGLEHHLVVYGTVPFESQGALVEEMMDVTGVVSARELLTTDQNVTLEVVRRNREGVKETLGALNDVGLEIGRIDMMKRDQLRPLDNFGKSAIEEE